jgi:hypothetical protein
VLLKALAKTLETGTLPSGGPTRRTLTQSYLAGDFQTESLPRSLGIIGGNPRGNDPRRPNDRISESFGTTANPDPFLFTEGQINVAKGAIMAQNYPLTPINLRSRARIAARNQGTLQQIQDSVNEMFIHIRAVCAVLHSSILLD